jgi:tetratricopeptide (TPR) repeat protein/predicted Ser/Thr protein kinase
MATVYLCDDTQTQEKVAVKVLRREIGSAVVVERFLREIEFASRLDHPRIPRVLDSGTTTDRTPFYVMTYIEGESLSDLLDRVKQLPIDEALSITSAVMEPMTYAHRMGIVHRDIKPGNIIIGVDGVHVLDFGIARAIVASAEDRLTSTGIAIGTPAYMSPEQALGDQDLDARSDIYSLGCVIYEMIAGIPPFVGATPQAAMARRFAAAAPPLTETRDGVPQHIVAAVAKALNRTPADRWQTVREFANALDKPAASESAQLVVSRLAHRRRTLGRLVGGGVIAALVASVAFTWSMTRDSALERAIEATHDWDLEEAEGLLRSTVDENPDDATSQLWLAQVTLLRGAALADWRAFALRAADNAARLLPEDRRRVEALVEFADDRSPSRCDKLEQLARATRMNRSSDFTLSLTYADCLRVDPIVIRDESSASGYRFRSSHNSAATEYEALLARNRTNDGAYQALMPRLETILVTSKHMLRGGRLQGSERTQFVASPSLVADTMAQVPYPLLGDGAVITEGDAGEQDRLIERNLERLQTLAEAWTKNSGTAEAHESLARLLESSAKLDGPGETALKHIRLAQGQQNSGATETESDFLRRLQLAVTEARLLVKLTRFEEAASLARKAIDFRPSVALADTTQEKVDFLKVGLAALTGQQSRALALELAHVNEYPVRLQSGEVKKLPPEIAQDAIRLENYSAFGSPRDSILAISRRLSEAVRALVPPAQSSNVIAAVLRRPLTLAAPSIGGAPLAALGPTSDPIAGAVRALEKGQLGRAQALSASLSAIHRESAPGEVTLDFVLIEAWLQASLGDSTAAAQTIDRALRGLSKSPPNILRSVILPAALVRVMLYRSQLGRTAGESHRDWAVAARQLWRDADPELVRLTRSSGPIVP